MKKLVLCCALLFFPLFSSAQIYTAGSGYYQHEPSVVFPWEVSIGVTGAFSSVTEINNGRLLNLQGGFSVRALYYPAPWVGVGAEGAWFFPAAGRPLVDEYNVLRGGVVSKFVAASETETRAYGLLAAGFGRREVKYDFGWSEGKSSAYFAFGCGVETDVADTSFGGLEIRGIYNTSAQLGSLVYLASRWETEASLYFGMRF